jgi:hypothetical protein
LVGAAELEVLVVLVGARGSTPSRRAPAAAQVLAAQ